MARPITPDGAHGAEASTIRRWIRAKRVARAGTAHGMSKRLPAGNRAPVRAIAGLSALDAPGKKLGKAVRTVIKPGPVKDALSGTWLGHALHPLLTDVTVGTWTSAVLLDWLGGSRSEQASERLIAIGLLSTAPVVASGYSDWADSEVADDEVRRVGVVHAATNAVASTLFAASLAARRRGGSGRLLALAGAGALGAGGYLGGHLAFADRHRRRPDDLRGRHRRRLDRRARRRRAAARAAALRRRRRHPGDARAPGRRAARALQPLLAPRRTAARGRARRRERSPARCTTASSRSPTGRSSTGPRPIRSPRGARACELGASRSAASKYPNAFGVGHR